MACQNAGAIQTMKDFVIFIAYIFLLGGINQKTEVDEIWGLRNIYYILIANSQEEHLHGALRSG
jgi:hypothetical protein